MSDFDEMNLGPRWYVIHTYSGYENKVKLSIEKVVENRALGHLIFDLQIPVELARCPQHHRCYGICRPRV